MLGNNSYLFRKVVIVGAGLIGGSIGMAIKKQRLANEVIGICRQHSSLVQALKNGAIDKASHDIKKSLQDADLVILATPVKTIISMLTTISDSLKRGCIVTDVGSTKNVIVEAAQKHLPGHAFFVGAHPLAGSEKRGAAYANVELFNNSLCLLTPTEKTNKNALERVKNFWVKLGARTQILHPQEHDKILAYISHVPHLLAYGLIGTIPPEFLPFASQGLKDTTRIAASDPEMWRDICLTNQAGILKSLDEFVKLLSLFRKALISKDENSLLENFKKAKARRDELDKP